MMNRGPSPKRRRVSELLGDPRGAGVAGHGDVHDLARAGLDEKEREDGLEPDVVELQEVARPGLMKMVLEERRPALSPGARPTEPAHVLLDGPLGDPDAQLQELAANTLRAQSRLSLASRRIRVTVSGETRGVATSGGLDRARQESLKPSRCQRWGGRRLTKLPAAEPIGEAWVLSDRPDHASVVADGPLEGLTLGQLLKQYPEQMMGMLTQHPPRFPLLLKFLGDVVVFEIQQNSDVTFRLYDWDHVDARTGQPRDLQVDQALASIDLAQGPVAPVTPTVDVTTPARERLFRCEHFSLWRVHARGPFAVGAAGAPRVLVCIEGSGQVEHRGVTYALGRGDLLLLPAAVGACAFRPTGAVTLLEIALPEPDGSHDAPAGQRR
jgi:hypothetical protein